jgi:hypothetical protein
LPEHVTTTNAGEYNAANLEPGVYRIEISSSVKFKTVVESGPGGRRAVGRGEGDRVAAEDRVAKRQLPRDRGADEP